MDQIFLFSTIVLTSAAVFVVFGLLQPGLPPHPERSLGRRYWSAETILTVWVVIAAVLSLPYVLFGVLSGPSGGPSLEAAFMPIGAFGIALVAVAQLVQWLRMRAAWKAIQQAPAPV